jgi:hypothetical protein
MWVEKKTVATQVVHEKYFIGIQEELHCFSIILTHMFPSSWKWTDAIIRLLCLHVCKRLPFCYLDVCHPVIILLSERFLTLQEEIKITRVHIWGTG